MKKKDVELEQLYDNGAKLTRQSLKTDKYDDKKLPVPNVNEDFSDFLTSDTFKSILESQKAANESSPARKRQLESSNSTRSPRIQGPKAAAQKSTSVLIDDKPNNPYARSDVSVMKLARKGPAPKKVRKI